MNLLSNFSIHDPFSLWALTILVVPVIFLIYAIWLTKMREPAKLPQWSVEAPSEGYHLKRNEEYVTLNSELEVSQAIRYGDGTMFRLDDLVIYDAVTRTYRKA